jgi:hypothetical protein
MAGKSEKLSQVLEVLGKWKKGMTVSVDEVHLTLKPSESRGRIESNSKLPDEILGQWLYSSFREPFVSATSDLSRLQSCGKFEEWLDSKGANRIFYWQRDDAGLLQTLGWMAVGKKLGNEEKFVLERGKPECILDYNASSAIRVYGERGKGRGSALKQVIMNDIELRFSVKLKVSG